ncbi:MAG: hypothetical protein AVDCRST_MAG55-2819, partial [uncultured Rubrobacteraceae bacterium]
VSAHRRADHRRPGPAGTTHPRRAGVVAPGTVFNRPKPDHAPPV